MLYCPVCCKLFFEDGEVCPYDGAELIVPPDSRLGTKVSSYLILKAIGKGGMGKVYKAEHVFIGKIFAIKILHPKFANNDDVVDRFLFEARAAARINHPNIIEITDFGYTDDKLPFFVMEYMEGKELIELIDMESPLPVYRTVNILTQVSAALAACHDEGIVHQDLKPENIFLVKKQGTRKLVHLLNDPLKPYKIKSEDSFDSVKVLDFGVAHLAKLKEEKTIAGTPEYMAPEQAQGITGDPRSDIYSLTIIFYEMLTATLPYLGDSADEIFEQVINNPVPDIIKEFPELNFSTTVKNVINKGLAKNPENRYQKMEDFIKDMRACFGEVFYSRDIPSVIKKLNKNVDKNLSTDLKSLFSSSKRKSSVKKKKILPQKNVESNLANDLKDLFKKK
jgi:eukaryotic-like serine/threonine-protein kinase